MLEVLVVGELAAGRPVVVMEAGFGDCRRRGGYCRGNLFANAIEPGAQCFAFIWRNALLGKIDRRVDVRQ